MILVILYMELGKLEKIELREEVTQNYEIIGKKHIYTLEEFIKEFNNKIV